MVGRHTFWMVVLCLALPALAHAQVTGSISGVVYDQAGAPVAGAVIKVSGDQLPAGRTVTTEDSGVFNFPSLLPGTYVVEITKDGVGNSKSQVVVELARDSQVPVVLGSIQEEVSVSARLPVVDMRSTEVSFNFKQEELQSLPIERSYRGLYQLIPGVADNRSNVGPAAGGTRQDNQYLIDGVNITNPLFGYLSTEVNQLDIAEVNIKRAGISAEFGRTGGAVTNAISRSGTNRLSGAGSLDFLPKGLIGGFDEPAFRDPLISTDASAAIGVGGPVLRDKLFFYGSARYFSQTKWDRINRFNDPLPDEERTGHELYGKLTATLATRHLLNVSIRHRPNEVKNQGLASDTLASVAYDSDNSARVGTAHWAYFMSDRSAVEVRFLYLRENNEDTPQNVLGYLPSPFNAARLTEMGRYRDPALANTWTGGAEYLARVNYQRRELKGAFTHFMDLGRSHHELKAGMGYEFGEEDYFRITNGWGEVVNLGTQLRARYYFEQPPQLGQGRTWSIFVQDNITIGQRLTANAGLLFNKDEFAQDLPGSNGCPDLAALGLLSGGSAPYDSSGDRCTFLRFGFGQQVQPRLGFNYNVRKDQGDKAYVNWGRYYNTDQKSSGRSLAPRRIYQREALFTLTGTLISDVPRASTSTKRIDPAIEPTYNDEILVGYATPIHDLWSIDTFFMYRKTNDFIEDVPSTLPTAGPFVAANLPCLIAQGCIGAEAKRSYKAFTVEVARRLANNWNANVSYTWSRFVGNIDFDYALGSVFNTSSILQDGPGTFVQDPNRYGPLLQDRPHVFKVFASWVPMPAVTLGSYFRVQSGTPWNARGQDRAGASALNYLEPAGAHRNPTWANLDLLGSYRLKVNGRATFTLEGRLLNALGNQTRLSTQSVQYLDTPSIATPPYIGTYTQLNPFFNTGNAYAPPRRLVLAVVGTF